MKTMPGKRIFLGLTAAAVLSIMAAAPRAEACGAGEGLGDVVAILYMGASSLTVNTGFTIHDLVVDRSSTASAVFETLLTVPQALIGVSLLASSIGDDGVDSALTPVILGYTLWSSALAAHGIYVLGSRAPKSEPASPASPPPPPWRQYDRPRVQITPTVVDDGMRKGMGLGVVGRF